MTALLPRSLLWRTFLLLAALVLLTTAAWFQIFRAYEIEPRARALAQNMASVVNLTHVALLTAQPEKRRELLAELARPHNPLMLLQRNPDARNRLIRDPAGIEMFRLMMNNPGGQPGPGAPAPGASPPPGTPPPTTGGTRP